MNLKITGINFDVTEAIKARVTEKLERIARHTDGMISATITLSVEKVQSKAAAQVHLAGKDFHVEALENGDNMYAAIDNMADKLDRALLQYKEKAQSR